MPKARKQKPIVRLERQQPQQQHQGQKEQGGDGGHKQHAASGGVRKPKSIKRRPHGKEGGQTHVRRAAGKLQCMSVVDRQAAAAVQALVEADAGRARGARQGTEQQLACLSARAPCTVSLDVGMLFKDADLQACSMLNHVPPQPMHCSIKTLTLAPHIQAKRATYAVTCQTMKCESAAQHYVPTAACSRHLVHNRMPTMFACARYHTSDWVGGNIQSCHS